MVVTPARRSCEVMGSSQISMDPQGLQRKSSEPQRMSCRAGMHGSDPVTCDVNRTARSRANRSRWGVSNSAPP